MSPAQHPGYADALTLAVSLCLTYTLCIACVRIWIRRGTFGYDDLIVLVATITTLGHTGSSYVALADGLGLQWTRLQDNNNQDKLNAASLAGVVTFIVALYVSKIGVLAFLSRVQAKTRNRKQRLLYYACCAVIAVFGLISMLLVTVDCPSPSDYYWAFYGNKASCPSQSVRWEVVTGLDIITEVLLLVLPVQLVWNLQMPRATKAVLLIAFYIRAPVIALSLGRNYYTLQLRLPKTDAGLNSALVVIWLEVQLAYALASSTLSALKAFTESFNSGFGLGFTRGKSDSNYALSGVSGQSGSSARIEKLKEVSATDSGVGSSGARSPKIQAIKYEDLDDADSRPLSPASPSALKLRPERSIKTFAIISAEPPPPLTSNAVWRHGSCGGSESSGEDMVILRETELSVQHDRAPILGRGGGYAV